MSGLEIGLFENRIAEMVINAAQLQKVTQAQGLSPAEIIRRVDLLESQAPSHSSLETLDAVTPIPISSLIRYAPPALCVNGATTTTASGLALRQPTPCVAAVSAARQSPQNSTQPTHS